jgi:hypothetical protein
MPQSANLRNLERTRPAVASAVAEGHVAPPIERFMPSHDVRERFSTLVLAPSEVVLRTAVEFDLQSVRPVRAIFRAREWLLGAKRTERRRQGLLADMRSVGWGLLDEQPGRFVVCGSICQPWRADVTFTPLAPAAFAEWCEPGWVKIAWTLEVDAVAPAATRFAHETRAVATDDASRVRFMHYWRWARVGIVAIRLLLLPAIRRAAASCYTTRRAAGESP